MDAYELVDDYFNHTEYWDEVDLVVWIEQAAPMLRSQADRIAELENVLIQIANERIELSYDKLRWQNEDHIKWAKEVLK